MRPPRNNEPMNKPSDKTEARDDTEAIAERAEWIKMAYIERLRQVGAHSGVREDTPPKRPAE